MTEIKPGYTRVSSILGQWNHLAHIPKHILDNKCRIGTNVHEKIAAEIEGIYLELEMDEEPYFHSWEQWNEQKNCEIVQTEKRYYDERLKITGQLDALLVQNDKLYICDFKTSASPNLLMWQLQATFYHHLCKPHHENLAREVIFLKLSKEGHQAIEYIFEPTAEVWKVCEAALQTYHYFNVDKV